MENELKELRETREETDESLRTEREKADEAALTRSRIQGETDARVERVRDQGDAVIEGVRDKTDHEATDAGTGEQLREAVVAERALEDSVIRRERAAMDESLQRERAEEARAVIALLPLERQHTNRNLMTERERSDEVVAHRDDFLAMVSHDLRNMLGGIAMQAMLLAEQATESDEGRRVATGMKQVQRYVARMNRLIGDLLDIASIDAGQLAIHPASADAAALLTEVVSVFALVAAEKGISLESEIAPVPIRADFDHERMFQVLANVITNAIKFTPPGGKAIARVENTDDDDEIHFTVMDTGPGIPGDMLEAVFERFWQVGNNDRRGLGLGLYISKCIVTAHGGRIWVESAPGEGSVFHIAIPKTVNHTERARR